MGHSKLKEAAGSRVVFTASLAGLLLLGSTSIQAAPATEVVLEQVLAGMSQTLDLKNAGDGRLFAVGQNGLIQIIKFDGSGNASLNATPFLDIGALLSTGGERGLLGLAFHPDYASNGFFYLDYTCLAAQQVECAGDGDTIISRHTVTADPDIATPGAGLVLATIPQTATNHNGGGLQFEPFPAPDDGRTILYISSGDGGPGNDPNGNAQNLGNFLGKILRVDVDDLDASLPLWATPTDNPNIGGSVTEIWSYGLRNPWRFSFDRLTGDMIIADVGQNTREEVNFQAAASPGGENYGWRQCEGTAVNFAGEAPGAPEFCFGGAGLTPPIVEYAHTNDPCDSITGGYVYRGAEFASELGGTYFYADYCSGRLWGVRNDGGGWVNIIDQHTELAFDFATFGERHNGELYLASLSGNLYRVRPPVPADPDLVVNSVDGPLYGFLGQTINVDSVQVQNQGGAVAGTSSLGYYFTTDPVNDPGQTFSGSVCPTPALGSGSNYNCQNISVDVPGALSAGSYSLVAITDDQDVVTESDETNNDRADLQQIVLIDCAVPGPELCSDSIDNDCDGSVDGDDSDCVPSCLGQGDACSDNAECCSQKCRGGRDRSCKGDATCIITENPEASCNDGLDNDCDGSIDGSDSDCAAGCVITENPEASCNDGLDNDCDGLFDADDSDCPSGCVVTETPESSCDDGLDNDCDGLFDTDDSDCPQTCAPKGNSCAVNGDCCSDKCKGNGSRRSCK